MRLKTPKGILRFKDVSKKLVDWDGPSRSKFQKAVKFYVRPLWHHHVVYEEFPVYGTLLSLDLFNANKKIAIEVQGPHHTEFNKGFHKNQFDYLEQLKKDEIKRRFCDINGITLVEIFYEEHKELSVSFMKGLGL